MNTVVLESNEEIFREMMGNKEGNDWNKAFDEIKRDLFIREDGGGLCRLWEHREPDLKDQSLHGYDLAIAFRFTKGENECNAIYTLLLSHGEKYGENYGTDRKISIANTVSVAEAAHYFELSFNELEVRVFLGRAKKLVFSHQRKLDAAMFAEVNAGMRSRRVL